MISSCESLNQLTDLIIDVLEENFEIKITKMEMQQKILSDMMAQDVPYFTERGGNLYYGLFKEGTSPIASRY